MLGLKVLKFFEAATHSAREPTLKTSPPLTWVKRKMTTKVQEWKEMSKTGRRKLIAAIRRCIHQCRRNPQSELAISNLTESREYVLNLITKTRMKIREQRFFPKMAVVPKHIRSFTILPLYSCQRRFVEIDTQTLRSLVHRAGGIVGPNIFWDAFDFTKIGVASLEEMQTPRRRFWSIVRSDGAAIDFLFSRPKRVAAPEKTMTDIKLDLEEDRLWGVDPGITDIFVAVDGNDNAAHEVRRTSTREFYHMSGWNRATQQGSKWKKENPAIQAIENGMPSPKTASTAVLDRFIAYVLQHYRELVAFYDDRWAKLRFQRFRGRQKALAEVCRRFTIGSKKYGAHRLDPQRSLDPEPPPNPVKWKRAMPHDEAKRTVVAFGDATFSPTMKGKMAGVSRIVFRALRHQERLGHLVLVKVPEFRSSKVCSKCQTLTLVPGSSLHAVLKCKNCATVWNRDVNAARNLRFIASHMSKNGNNVPEIFTPAIQASMSGSEP